MTKNANIIKKICLIGTYGVGKTSLIKRYILDIFDDQYLKTLGTKVSKKEFEIEYPEKDLNINLTLLVWDIMGQETFRTILQDSYFFGTGGGLAICDSTNALTLEALDGWVESLVNVAGEVPLIFIANKYDLKDERKIDEDLIKEFAGKYDYPYFYASAKTGHNVEKAFYELGKMMTSDIE